WAFRRGPPRRESSACAPRSLTRGLCLCFSWTPSSAHTRMPPSCRAPWPTSPSTCLGGAPCSGRQ
ncbi:unnamed protein product, partial [Ectocarpus fasciculatus]